MWVCTKGRPAQGVGRPLFALALVGKFLMSDEKGISNAKSIKDVMDDLRVEAMEEGNISNAVDNHAHRIVPFIWSNPSDLGLSCTKSVTLFEKENGGFCLIIKGLSQPGRHKVRCFTDAERWQDTLVQFASDVTSDRIDWKSDDGAVRQEKASFYDDLIK